LTSFPFFFPLGSPPPPPPPPDSACSAVASCRVWLYTLVAANYDGALLLPHFLDHYSGLGIQKRHMLIHIHHNPKLYASKAELNAVLAVCKKSDLKCRWANSEDLSFIRVGTNQLNERDGNRNGNQTLKKKRRQKRG
jgi:hypothetical protein